MAYATAAELRIQIEKSGTTGAGSDTNLDFLLEAATETIDGFCNRPDGFEADEEASARYYSGKGKPYLLIDECVEITEVAVKDSPSDTAYVAWDSPSSNLAGDGDWLAFRGNPKRPIFNKLPYTAIMTDINGDYSVFTTGRYVTRGGFRPSTGVARDIPTVKVTAKWGYAATVPYRVKEACLSQAARWFKRGEGAWSDTLGSAETGTLQFRKSLDPDIQMMLSRAGLVKPAIA